MMTPIFNINFKSIKIIFVGLFAITNMMMAKDLKGKWTEINKAKEIEIYRVNDKYYAKMLWAKDEELSKNYVFLKDAVFNNVSKVYEGTLHPSNGFITLNAEITLITDSTLSLRASKFFFHKTILFTRSH